MRGYTSDLLLWIWSFLLEEDNLKELAYFREQTRSTASCHSYNPRNKENGAKGGFGMPNPVRKEQTAPGGATRLRIAMLALACAFVVGALLSQHLRLQTRADLGNQRT
jgi:hypothetical protein